MLKENLEANILSDTESKTSCSKCSVKVRSPSVPVTLVSIDLGIGSRGLTMSCKQNRMVELLGCSY